MPDAKDSPITHVLTTRAVVWAIHKLRESKCHSSFLLYLLMRRSMLDDGSANDIRVDFGELRALLTVDGGPAAKPMYQPLSDRGTELTKSWVGANFRVQFVAAIVSLANERGAQPVPTASGSRRAR